MYLLYLIFLSTFSAFCYSISDPPWINCFCIYFSFHNPDVFLSLIGVRRVFSGRSPIFIGGSRWQLFVINNQRYSRNSRNNFNNNNQGNNAVVTVGSSKIITTKDTVGTVGSYPPGSQYGESMLWGQTKEKKQLPACPKDRGKDCTLSTRYPAAWVPVDSPTSLC